MACERYVPSINNAAACQQERRPAAVQALFGSSTDPLPVRISKPVEIQLDRIAACAEACLMQGGEVKLVQTGSHVDCRQYRAVRSPTLIAIFGLENEVGSPGYQASI